jgi:cell division initiation protein
MTEREKEKLVDIKQEIKALKQEITRTLKKYEMDLDKVVEFTTLQETDNEVRSDNEISGTNETDESDDTDLADDIIEEIMEEYVGKANS